MLIHKRIYLLSVICSLLCPRLARAANDIYISQNGGANIGGCAATQSVSYFNSSSNWAPSGSISPGTTVHLCGTFTTALIAGGSGTAGSPIRIQWEPGAVLSVCSASGALQLGSQSYLTIDMGGNNPAITCPNNGTGLATSVHADGISNNNAGGAGFSNTEIRNGTIGPLYVYSCCGPDGVGTHGIYNYATKSVVVHDVSFNSSNVGAELDLGNGVSTTGDAFYNNTCARTVGRCLQYANGDGRAMTSTGMAIHNNDITFGDAWYSGAGDYTHLEAMHIFPYGGASAQDNILGILIYNNYIHGIFPSDTTSGIFIEDGLSGGNPSSTLSASIFNNVIVKTGGSGPGDGLMFFSGTYQTVSVYNNTIDGVTNTNTMCMELEGGHNTYTVENNICENLMAMIYNQDGAPTLIASNNIYFNVGSTGFNGWAWNSKEYTTLSGWKTATAQDGNSNTSNPGLNADYTITGTASAAYQSGVNLTSLGISALDTGKPLNVGVGNSSSQGAARPASGAWDIGAYQYIAAGGTYSSCDINRDGLTNIADVQMEINMALQKATCTNSSGMCNVASVQKVINAALGGSCVAP